MSQLPAASEPSARHPRYLPFCIKLLIMVAVLVAVYLLSFLIGSVDLSVGEVADILVAQVVPNQDPYWEPVLEHIV